jgi:hypothetical protein
MYMYMHVNAKSHVINLWVLATVWHSITTSRESITVTSFVGSGMLAESVTSTVQSAGNEHDCPWIVHGWHQCKRENATGVGVGDLVLRTANIRAMKLNYMFLVNQFLKSSEGIWSTFIFQFSTFLRVDIWIDFQTEAPAQEQAWDEHEPRSGIDMTPEHVLKWMHR